MTSRTINNNFYFIPTYFDYFLITKVAINDVKNEKKNTSNTGGKEFDANY